MSKIAATTVKSQPKSQPKDKSSVTRANVLGALAAIKKITGATPVGSTTVTFPHIPSNIIQIDNLLGGSPLPDGSGLTCPGYARGRIIEVYGAESSGKTTLALGAIGNVRKMGGTSMFLDFENSLHHGYAQKVIGGPFNDTDTICYAPDTLEDGFKMLYIAIKAGFDLIVVDSVAAMIPKKELDKKLGDVAAIGALARAMSENISKLVQWQKKAPNTVVMLLNQIRSTITSGPGDNETTAGGKAVKFYATHRLKLTRIRSDIIERVDPNTGKKKKVPFGNVTLVKVVKNKLDGKQGHTAEVFIRYGYGLDEFMSLIECGIPRKIIHKEGATYTYNGEKFKGKDRLRKYLIENPKAAAELRAKIHKALLQEKPEAASQEEEVEDDDIQSDSTAGISDDDQADSGIDEEALDVAMSAEEFPEG